MAAAGRGLCGRSLASITADGADLALVVELLERDPRVSPCALGLRGAPVGILGTKVAEAARVVQEEGVKVRVRSRFSESGKASSVRVAPRSRGCSLLVGKSCSRSILEVAIA